MRPFGARLSVLLATLVVVLASVAAHRSQYFCKMMGQAVAECCCASAREHVRQRPAAKLWCACRSCAASAGPRRTPTRYVQELRAGGVAQAQAPVEQSLPV